MRPSQPYLATIAPLPLRFLPPPPDVSTDPAPAAPPNPDGVVGEVAQSNLEAVAPVPRTDAVNSPAPDAPDAVDAPAAPAEDPNALPSADPEPPARAPVEIIPDDLHREVMPEDVLPFFLPPQLSTGPQSQAIYRQK